VRVLEAEGFALVRERGDHMIFSKPGVLRPLVVPRYDALPIFIIKNALRTAQISRERYIWNFSIARDVQSMTRPERRSVRTEIRGTTRSPRSD
jgi:predicted RNA binding protein YcfA (HicA-like mRNA interferase family)